MADDPTPPDDTAARLGVLRVIAAALVVGLVTLTGVLVTVSLARGAPPGDPWAEAGLAVALSGLVVGITSIAAGLVGFPLLTAGRPLTGEPAAAYTAEWIVRGGLIEGAGVVQLVLYLAGGNPLLLVGAAVALVALVGIFPTDRRYADWLAAKTRD